jgi:hypothetical protein
VFFEKISRLESSEAFSLESLWFLLFVCPDGYILQITTSNVLPKCRKAFKTVMCSDPLVSLSELHFFLHSGKECGKHIDSVML